MPPRCVDCNCITSIDHVLCHECWPKYKFIDEYFCKKCGRGFDIDIDSECLDCIKKPPYFDISRSLFKYDDNSKKIIHHFKYHDKTSLSIFFARTLYRRYKDLIDDSDIITYVPMHRFKRIFRLYNQAFILAKEISKISKTPILPDLLVKHKYTKPQTSLSRTKRKKNLIGSISANEKYDISKKKLLLIDDVITTGETINLCAKILKGNGAEKVTILSIAKTYS